MRENLGPDDRDRSQTPEHRVARLARQRSSIARLEARRSGGPQGLWEGGAAAIAASNDPMIVLARDIDRDARAVRKIYEDEVQAPVAAAQEKIAKARFAVLGTNTYPDATSRCA